MCLSPFVQSLDVTTPCGPGVNAVTYWDFEWSHIGSFISIFGCYGLNWTVLTASVRYSRMLRVVCCRRRHRSNEIQRQDVERDSRCLSLWKFERVYCCWSWTPSTVFPYRAPRTHHTLFVRYFVILFTENMGTLVALFSASLIQIHWMLLDKMLNKWMESLKYNQSIFALVIEYWTLIGSPDASLFPNRKM